MEIMNTDINADRHKTADYVYFDVEQTAFRDCMASMLVARHHCITLSILLAKKI